MYYVHMKKRITIYLDEDLLDAFRTRAEEAGAGYQTLINDALRRFLAQQDEMPQRRSLAEVLLSMPEITGHDDLFERPNDRGRDVDVFD
jgi:metal-responsive CopG/Arc/MetJ family transcriptional regulator